MKYKEKKVAGAMAIVALGISVGTLAANGSPAQASELKPAVLSSIRVGGTNPIADNNNINVNFIQVHLMTDEGSSAAKPAALRGLARPLD